MQFLSQSRNSKFVIVIRELVVRLRQNGEIQPTGQGTAKPARSEDDVVGRADCALGLVPANRDAAEKEVWELCSWLGVHECLGRFDCVGDFAVDKSAIKSEKCTIALCQCC